MPSRLVDNQIQLNSRLRAQTVSAVKRIWQALPDYNEGVLDQWLSQVLPVVLAAQRQQVALTETYLARALDRPAIGVDVEQLIGAAARGGTSPEEVYRRPFITLWSALGDRVPWADAVGYGQARAASSAAMDVQMAMRNT